MRPLTADDVLRIWERGQAQRLPERAIALLAAMLPGTPPEELADLPLGRRDALLLRARETLCGPELGGYAECPRCRTRLEFALDSAALRGEEPSPLPPEALRMSVEEYELRFRLPTGRDLAAVATCDDAEQGRALLLRHCVLEVRRDDAPMPVESLPETVAARLAEQMAACDPGAETMLDLACPACDHHWQAELDIAAFLWTELAAQARRLLREVHTLARAYSWREGDILAMSAARRQCYLEMVE